jgi:hypothetical protein
VAFLGVGLYVPAVAGRLGLVPVPVELLLTIALIEVLWMSLLEVRKFRRRPRQGPLDALAAPGIS